LLVTSLLSGCGALPVRGAQPTAPGGIEAGTVAGLPVSNGPSGPRPGVVDARATALGTDRGEMDRLAQNAMADVQDYWKTQFPKVFKTDYQPVSRLISYDSGGPAQVVCQTSTEGQANAFYCPAEDTIAWDRGNLLPLLTDNFGPLAVVTVLAHETGHLVQNKLRETEQGTPTIVLEQQADCYAGAFFRHVAEGSAPHFQMSTGKGLNQVLAAMFFIRDQPGSAFTGSNAHGNAFDRVLGFRLGFTDGPARCRAIDVPEVRKRITAFGFSSKKEASSGGELPINQDSVAMVGRHLDLVFTPDGFKAPRLRLGNSCASGRRAGTSPTAYCVGENLVPLDINGLARIGLPLRRGPSSAGLGDFAAFGEIASRYVLAVQQQAGLTLSGQIAALRTSCLVGSWSGLLLENPWGQRQSVGDLRLAAGDLDEAVAELLSERSLIAADVDGKTVPSGFARVEAFQVGFLDGTSACLAKFKG
jgi:predicted metalloprotease